MTRSGFGVTGRAVACAVVMVCAATTGARAQVIALLDPSARAGGMGGASVAVGWNGPGSAWLNPALVATGRGFSVQASTQQLLPGIAEDLKLRASSFAVSYAGIGLASSGRPFGDETLVMPFGRVVTDSFGNFTSTSGWLESMASRSAAVSFAGVADAALAVLGHPDARLSDWGDVAWGRTWKRVDSALGFYGASLTARDEGWFARAVPWDTRRGREAPDGGTRLEVGYGRSTRDDLADPVFSLDGVLYREERSGVAVHFTWWGPSRAGAPGAMWTDAFRGAFSPLFDVTLSRDHEREFPLSANDRRPDPVGLEPYAVDHYGAEVTLSRVLTGRFGYLDDPTGQIQKPTWGLGACLPFRRTGEVRYDFASWPQGYDRRVYRHEVSLRFDPLAHWLGGSQQDGDRTRTN